MFLDFYNKNFIKKIEKEVVTTTNSFSYWCDTLFEKALRIFEWNGLPFPQKEIEMRLLYDGFCGFVDDANCGKMVATGSLSGPTQYFDEFTHFTYAAPTARGGQLRIGKDCVVVDNNALRNSLYPLIERYASLLAHADVTLKCALVNSRAVDTYAVEDNATGESVNDYYNKIYEGKNSVIIDDSLVKAISNLSSSRNNSTTVNDALQARNELLKSFYNEIGVRYARDKRERMITDEVNTDQQMLLLNVKDMLKQRKKACEEINRMFGLNVSVELSPEFELIDNDVEIDEGEDNEG